jgi:hypothetical protein
MQRVQTLPDSSRRRVMAVVGPLARRGGGDEPHRRPAEAPPGSSASDDENPFRGRRQGALVPEGDYLMTVTVAGQTVRHVVRVERVGPVAETEFGPDDLTDEERREMAEEGEEP